MLLGICAILVIGVLAYAMRRASKGTPFANNCPCTPNIDHLRWVEKGEKREDKIRENRW